MGAKMNYSRNFADLCECVSMSLASRPFLLFSIEALIDFVSKQSESQDVIFIIDEFSYFVKESDGFLGLFARAVDKQRDCKGLKIVIAGPSLDIMSEANAIFLPIATGANKYKDIATRLGKKDGSGVS